MPRFFVEPGAVSGDRAVISGDDARHITKSLRMREGESIVLCDGGGNDYFGKIAALSGDMVSVDIERTEKSVSEPKCKVTLYQGMPKSDKLELITEKTVELGVCEIVPVLMSRCVSRPDDKSAQKRAERLRRHALEAAKQCGRGIVPQVRELISFDEMEKEIGSFDKAIVFYEDGGDKLGSIIEGNEKSVCVIIGPEGGLEKSEVERLCAAGARAGTMGKRILRTETAAMTAVTLVLACTGDME